MEPIANRVGKPAPDEAQIIFQKVRSEFMRLIGKYLKGFNFTRSGFIFRRTVIHSEPPIHRNGEHDGEPRNRDHVETDRR